MKFGLFAINYGTCANPETTVEIARHAEAVGFESVWTGEHVVIPDPPPTPTSFPPTLPFLDTTIALTWVAAHTTTLKVGSGIIVLPLRNPVLLAKELATLDVVTRGRLIVGVAAGYVRAEFDAVGVPFAERHERTDDHLAAMRALWTMEHPHHESRLTSFAGIDAYPRPTTRGGPPVVVGGESRAALRRAVTTAHGWYGFDVDVPKMMRALREAAVAHERPAHLGPLEVTITPTGGVDRDAVKRFEDLGVDRLVLLPRPWASSEEKHRPVRAEEIIRNIDAIANELIHR